MYNKQNHGNTLGYNMTRNLMKEKSAISMLIAAIVIIIVVVAAAGAGYYLTSQNPAATPAPSASPTASPTQTPAATSSPETSETPLVTQSPALSPTPGSSQPLNVAGATSLRYSVSLTEAGVFQGSYTFQGKNAETSNFKMRIDFTDKSGDQSTYIVNGADHKAWIFESGQWQDVSVAYDAQFSSWNNLWQGYTNSLLSWNGIGDYSYTQGDATVKIYDVSVNPVLADSLFQHT
jgi:hypothetical protein